MRITIENDQLIYIYTAKGGKGKLETIVHVACKLLYDEQGNWLGIRVLNDFSDQEECWAPLSLPLLRTQDIQVPSHLILQSEECLEIKFTDCAVAKSVDQECNLDVGGDDGVLYGIEIILWPETKLGKKVWVEPFLIYDMPFAQGQEYEYGKEDSYEE